MLKLWKGCNSSGDRCETRYLLLPLQAFCPNRTRHTRVVEHKIKNDFPPDSVPISGVYPGWRAEPTAPARHQIENPPHIGQYLAGRSRRNSSAVSRKEEIVDFGHVDVDLRIDQNPLRRQRSQLKFRFGRMGPVTKTFRRMALPGIFRELAALCRSAIAQSPFDAIGQMPCIRGAGIWQALHLRRSPCCCTNSAKLSNATNPFWILCLRIAGHPRPSARILRTGYRKMPLMDTI